jgi:uncharacterized protein (DUF305 family)
MLLSIGGIQPEPFMDFRVGNLLSGALGVTLALAACSSGSRETPTTAPAPTARSSSKPGTGRYPYTQADADFMSHMIAHHAQALVMSGWAPGHGASPAVQRLAERIVNGQQDEIATMQRWLRDRKQPVPEPGAAMKMGPGHQMHEMLMPGMLTDAQMKELDQARGPEFDRLFLTYMIQHHRGAVTMVQQLFGTRGAAQDEVTFKLASDVSADQSSEITRMESMLAGLPGAQGAP